MQISLKFNIITEFIQRYLLMIVKLNASRWSHKIVTLYFLTPQKTKYTLLHLYIPHHKRLNDNKQHVQSGNTRFNL